MRQTLFVMNMKWCFPSAAKVFFYIHEFSIAYFAENHQSLGKIKHRKMSSKRSPTKKPTANINEAFGLSKDGPQEAISPSADTRAQVDSIFSEQQCQVVFNSILH
jgi:hypothetical protein